MSDQTIPTFRRHGAGLLIGCLAVGAVASCDMNPGHTPIEWSLSQQTLDQFEEAGIPPSAEAHLMGALGLMFGEAEHPFYLQTEDMLDEEFYPNDGGKGELSDEAIEELRSDNRHRRFKSQIRLIEEGSYGDLRRPLYAADLWEAWLTEFAPLHSPEAGEDGKPGEAVAGDSVHPDPYYSSVEEGATWTQEAAALFETWYPTLDESTEMYRQQCLHCHGNEGGGDGPTAAFLVPRPRDYRQGKFKRVTVDRNGRPTRSDLLTILNEGIYGSAMPNFKRFSRGELEGLVDYVRLLSMRGENELLLAAATVDSESYDVPLGEVESNYDIVWNKWKAAESKVIELEGEVLRPEEVTPERIEHGRELFMSTEANCFSCHGSEGRGDGESLFEEVTTVDEEGEESIEKRKLLDEWGNETRSRNFRLGYFRFGSRPIDLYRRIKVGISGTIMPAAIETISDDDIWDLVYYVRSISSQYDLARVAEAKTAAIHAAHAAEHAGDHGPADGDSEEGHEDPAEHGDGH